MNTKKMIEVMQAFEDGKKIEYSIVGRNDWTRANCVPVWAWDRCEYRIAPEPKKEGRWERVKIKRCIDGDYVLNTPPYTLIDACPRFFGFGGIDYQSPFDEKHIARSMAPVMFDPFTGHAVIMGFAQADSRPGIPVAAWFWREE